MVFTIFLLIFSFAFADLIRPENDANLTYIYVPFEWEQEPNIANYNLQISTQQSFDNMIIYLIFEKVYLKSNM